MASGQLCDRFFEPLRAFEDALKEVADAIEAGQRVTDVELLGAESRGHLAPGERSRHRSARVGPQYVRRGDGLAFGDFERHIVRREGKNLPPAPSRDPLQRQAGSLESRRRRHQMRG